MILFPDDIQAINELLRQRADLDPELLEACQEHIDLGQYDVAVFKAFRVLEGRVQHRSGIVGRNAGQTCDRALDTDGPLTRRLGLTFSQAVNLRDLLKACFALFRNPEAHPQDAIIEYGSAECQAVLAFVNLMLGILDRQPDDPLKAALRLIRRDIGPDATARLSTFMERVQTLELKMIPSTHSHSFRTWAWRRTTEGGDPKRELITLFYLGFRQDSPRITFPVLGHWIWLAEFDNAPYLDRLKALGCVEGRSDLRLYMRDHNATSTFEQLYAIVRDFVQEMKETLAAHGQRT